MSEVLYFCYSLWQLVEHQKVPKAFQKPGVRWLYRLSEGAFPGCFGLFCSNFLTTRIFLARQFSQKVKASFVFSFYTNSSQFLSLIFLKHFSLSWVSPYMQRHKEKQWLQISGWSINPANWLDKRFCCDELQTKNTWQLFSFHCIFNFISFSVQLQLLSNLWAPHTIAWSLGHIWTCLTRPYEKIGWNIFFVLAICLHAKINVIQWFHQGYLIKYLINFWLSSYKSRTRNFPVRGLVQEDRQQYHFLFMDIFSKN